MAIEKLTTRLKKKKTGPIHKLNTTKTHELKPIRPHIQHTNPEHI